MKTETGIRLVRDDEHADLQSLETINAVLAPIGTRIWAMDWSGLSEDLKDFLADPDPTAARAVRSEAKLPAIPSTSGGNHQRSGSRAPCPWRWGVNDT